MKIQNILFIIVLTAISGFLSVYPFPSQIYEKVGANVALVQPGLFFGLVTGIYFLITSKLSFVNFFLWILCSTIAYFVAFYSSIVTFILGPFLYVASGVMGAAILAWGVKNMISEIHPLHPILTVGGIAGFVFGIFFKMGLDNPNPLPDHQVSKHALIGYIIWQMAVAITIYIMLEKNKSLNEEKNAII